MHIAVDTLTKVTLYHLKKIGYSPYVAVYYLIGADYTYDAMAYHLLYQII